MGYILLLGVLFLNIRYSFGSKNIKIVIYLSLIIMLIFIAYNTDNADLMNYQYHFDEYKTGLELVKRPEILYQIYLFCGAKLLNTYTDFLMFTGFAIVTLFYWIIKKIWGIANVHNFLWLFFLYPLFPNIVQIRSFIGCLIFCMFFIGYWKKNSKIFFLFGILLAGTFHISFLFFAPFVLLLDLDDRKQLKRLFYFYTLMASIAIIFCFWSPTYLIHLAGDFIQRFGGYHYAYMLEEASNQIRWYARLIYVLILVTENFFSYVIFTRIRQREKRSSFTFRAVKSCMLLNFYSGLFMPMIFVTSQAERVFRYVFVVNAIMLSIYMKLKTDQDKKFNLLLEVVLALVVFWCFVFSSSETFNNGFRAVLENNILWQQ